MCISQGNPDFPKSRAKQTENADDAILERETSAIVRKNTLALNTADALQQIDPQKKCDRKALPTEPPEKHAENKVVREIAIATSPYLTQQMAETNSLCFQKRENQLNTDSLDGTPAVLFIVKPVYVDNCFISRRNLSYCGAFEKCAARTGF